MVVGRTVPSFRLAADIELTKWKQFRSYLDKKDRKMFDQMYDCVKLYNTASMKACRRVVIHLVLMSIIFEHYKQLTKLMDQKKEKDRTPTKDFQYAGFVDIGKVKWED